MSERQKTPVLVLGSGLTALGVIRTFARTRIPTMVVASGDDPVRHSRWFRAAPGFHGPMEESALSSYLERLPLESAVLMPCSDAWALAVSRLDPYLAARFPASLAPRAVLESFIDKARFAQLARAAGVPHPRTLVLESVDDVDRIPDEGFHDIFLKPRDSQRFFQRYGVKAFRVRDRADATAKLVGLMHDGHGIVLQEYVPGPTTNHYFIDGFVDRDGRIRALFARRRLRIYPPDFGNSTYMVSVPLAEAAGAVESVERLVEHCGFRGIFSAEFKVDERDGIFKILELNARPWWYIEFTARCGVDVCSPAYDDALGRPVDSVGEYRVGRSCVYWYYDYFACRALRREGHLSLVDWATSWLGGTTPFLSWRDPFPALAVGWELLSRAVGRRLGLQTAARPTAALKA